MEQTNNDEYNKAFTDTPVPLPKDVIEETEDWLNEHGEPDFAFLQALASEGTIEALDKLRSIAEDLDVEYDENTPSDVHVARILSTVAQNEDEGPEKETS
jgi:hypothetical protein